MVSLIQSMGSIERAVIMPMLDRIFGKLLVECKAPRLKGRLLEVILAQSLSLFAA